MRLNFYSEVLKHELCISAASFKREIWFALMGGFSSATPAFNPALSAELKTDHFDLRCNPPSDTGTVTGSPVVVETSSLFSWRGNSSMFSLPTCSLMTYHSV